MAGEPGPRRGSALRDLAILHDAGVIVAEGRIAAVGASAQIRAQASGLRIVEADGRTLTPGFVDAHTHANFARSRVEEFDRRCAGASYQEIAAAGGGIVSSVAAVRESSESDLTKECTKHLAWMAASGTTTAEVKSGYGLSLDDEIKMLRTCRAAGPVRVVPTFLGAHAVPVEFKSDPEGYEKLIEDEMLPAVSELRLADWADIFCDPMAFDLAATRRIMTRAKALGFQLRLHVDQHDDAGGAALAAELGAKTADHLEFTGPAGIHALAQADVMPVLLPGSVYALGRDRYPNARAMIEAGLPIVLATDLNPGSSPVPSMPFVMNLACTHMGLSCAEAMTAATVNAAYTLDLGHEVGSIEIGKQADLVLWDVPDYRESIYYVGAPLVNQVWIGGEPI